MKKSIMTIALGSIVGLVLTGCASQNSITLNELKTAKNPLVVENQKYELTEKQKELRASKKFESMLFFNKYTYSDELQQCVKSCNDYSLNKNGYTQLNEAQSDGWELYTKMEEEIVEISDDCSCSGQKILLKRKR